MRTGDKANAVRSIFDYAATSDLPQPLPDSLEFFLVERYRLYASAPTGLWRGSVFHQPYPLNRANVLAWDEQLLALNGFEPTGRPPDHIVMSHGMDVEVFPLEPVEQCARHRRADTSCQSFRGASIQWKPVDWLDSERLQSTGNPQMDGCVVH